MNAPCWLVKSQHHKTPHKFPRFIRPTAFVFGKHAEIVDRYAFDFGHLLERFDLEKITEPK